MPHSWSTWLDTRRSGPRRRVVDEARDLPSSRSSPLSGSSRSGRPGRGRGLGELRALAHALRVPGRAVHGAGEAHAIERRARARGGVARGKPWSASVRRDLVCRCPCVDRVLLGTRPTRRITWGGRTGRARRRAPSRCSVEHARDHLDQTALARAVGPSRPVTPGELGETCSREDVAVPLETWSRRSSEGRRSHVTSTVLRGAGPRTTRADRSRSMTYARGRGSARVWSRRTPRRGRRACARNHAHVRGERERAEARGPPFGIAWEMPETMLPPTKTAAPRMRAGMRRPVSVETRRATLE